MSDEVGWSIVGRSTGGALVGADDGAIVGAGVYVKLGAARADGIGESVGVEVRAEGAADWVSISVADADGTAEGAPADGSE